MDEAIKNLFPFLTRKMLNFEHGARFGVRISSQGNTAGVITIRGITKEGVFTFKHAVLSTGAIATDNFNLPDMPIFLSAADESGTFKQGDAYITVTLTLNGDRLTELCSGFAYSQKAVTYPTSNGGDIHPGKGRIRFIAGTTPGATQKIQWAVPAGRVWRLLSATWENEFDGAGSARTIFINIFDTAEDRQYMTFPPSSTVAIDSQDFMYWNIYGVAPGTTVGGDIINYLPQDIYIPEGFNIGVTGVNLRAGDIFHNPFIQVEEFLEVPA
jgi:hypothetical protein